MPSAWNLYDPGIEPGFLALQVDSLPAKLPVKPSKQSEGAQSCQTLCDPMDCSLPGSSIHGVLEARTLEWVAFPFSRDSYQPRDQTQVSSIAGGFFTI